MTKKELVEQMEERFAEWLDEVVLPFYESNIKNPEIIGKEMSFPFDDNLTLTPEDVDYVFSDWLDEVYTDQFENFGWTWAENYDDVSLEAFDVKLCNQDFKTLKELGDEEFSLKHEYDCIVKAILPVYDIREKEVLIRFETRFITVEFGEPFYNEWEFIDEKDYGRIKEALDSLSYLTTPYKDRYREYSDWEVPSFDDPEITKEHVTEDIVDADLNDDDDEEYRNKSVNERISDGIRDTISGWFLYFDVDDKCSKISKNLKYLKEDEVLKIEILSEEDFVLDCDVLYGIFEDCYVEWWERHDDDELGLREFKEDIWVRKYLNCPELDFEYDKENKMLTIRATFSVYYHGHIVDDEMDSDYAERCYEEDECPSDYSTDDEYDDGCWWDGYPSEDAFWECNGI